MKETKCCKRMSHWWLLPAYVAWTMACQRGMFQTNMFVRDRLGRDATWAERVFWPVYSGQPDLAAITKKYLEEVK